MNDKELADRIVALGVGEYRGDDRYLIAPPTDNVREHGPAKWFVRDWRVAGALLHCISYGQLIHICVDLFDQLEIRPRAICEACVVALER